MATLTGRMFGHYHVLERVGRGGMAMVYRAFDRKSDQDVAIKFIAPPLAQDEEFIRRFRREVKVVARLDHPNIVPVHDYGEQDGYAYLVMPFLNVGNLTTRMQESPLTLEDAGRLMKQISSALAYAHRHGIVHRDVKPSNILLDEHGRAILSDFGLARSYSGSSSLTGSAVIGTPAYMAPEQVQGKKAEARSDQYALGVVLFQLATGTLPFEGDTPIAVLIKHVNEPFPAPRSRDPNVPEAIERVILKATAKDPEQRFETVMEMNRSLQAAIAHTLDPVANRAPTIEIPEQTTLDLPVPERSARPRPLLRIGVVAAAGLLLILAFPVFANGLLDLLARASSPAEGSFQDGTPANAELLTEQAGTIAALETELAGSGDRSMAPEQIKTAAVQTVAAESGLATPLDAEALAALASGSPVPSPTLVPGAPTPTPGENTPSALGGPTAVDSPTPAPTASASPTIPTLTATLSPSATLAPSATPLPSNTPAPTPVPTEDTCSMLSLGGASASGKKVSFGMSNGSSTTVTILTIGFSWPEANGALTRIRFGSSTLWNGSADPTSIDVSPSTGNRKLEFGDSKSLVFEFASEAAGSGYGLSVQLDYGCDL
jgi:serine/threonine protein kinase